MPGKSNSFSSAFTTADKLLKEDKSKSINRKRFDSFVDMMIRQHRLDPKWKDDPEAQEKLKLLKKKNEGPRV